MPHELNGWWAFRPKSLPMIDQKLSDTHPPLMIAVVAEEFDHILLYFRVFCCGFVAGAMCYAAAWLIKPR
jgi:hypothetical protein